MVEGVANVLGDAIAAPLELGADLLDDIGPDVIELADAAVVTAVASGRIGLRVLSRTIGFIGRHPKKVLVGLVVVAATAAVMSYVCSNSDSNSSADA